MSFFFRNFARFFEKGMQILIVIGLILAAMGLLCVGVIFRKDHTFRSQHIRENARMKQDKIHCSTAQDREERMKYKKKIDIKNL